ncbi:hypothetical protein [Candidatus Oscillochloris fontis]|uniref:hypothetical protein n=1 Tax=Candidatus Oscillochloris fontis TaxID=2496868 RepID=UPI00101D422E|nr:hypothetical protein [Candidatus Oscillochloris fontis]
MIQRRVMRPALLLLLFALLTLQPVAAQSLPAVILVDHERHLTLNGPFVGLGAEDDSNLLWSGPNQAAGANPAYDTTHYVNPRLNTLDMPLVRKFIDVSWFAPTPDGYDWDTPAMHVLYANLALHYRNNTQVMLTIWSLPPWLSAEAPTYRNTERQPAIAFPDPAHEEEWVTLIIDLLRHLYGMDGSGLYFSNITYVGGPNELEGIDASRLVRPYSLLRTRLAEVGLANRVALFGPDSFVEELLIAHHTPGLSPLLDVYDFHYYAAAPFEAGFTAAIDRLVNATATSGKQIWLTEFGELSYKNDDWRSLPIFVISGMNHGLAALLVWNVQDQIYNTSNMPAWGLWGVYESGYALKPAYYAWQMLAAHTPRQGTVYGHPCDRAQCPGLRLAVVGGSGGALSIIAYNMSDSAYPLELDLGELEFRSPLGRYTLDPSQPLPHSLAIPREAAPALNASILRDTLPAGALVVYATDRPRYYASTAPKAGAQSRYFGLK